MERNDQFRFVSLLALELENGDISLPSLPDVVLKIRKMLARDNCNVAQVSQAVSVDPVLVSRLFVFANSAFYNRANVRIETLDGAISRLGFDVVRNTAMSMAMKQLYGSDKHNGSATHQRAVWARGMKLSSMAYAVAARHKTLNKETAYLCGLMHEVGKLYILTKAVDFPDFLGDPGSLKSVMQEWNPQISKSIIESWGFPENVIESADPATYVNNNSDSEPDLADVMVVARLLVDGHTGKLEKLFEEDPSFLKLAIDEAAVSDTMLTYRNKLVSMQQSLA